PLDANKRFPFKMKIPATDMTLYYAHASWLTYKAKLKTLLTSSKAITEHQISLHGINAQLIMDGGGAQRFWNSGHNGIDLQVENVRPYSITWGDMQALLRGLEMACWLQLCRFEFANESGTRIGSGSSYKV
ncbi:MAG: hypothetical protein Q9191_006983, partial [Dirinaria sp. TL-2023a]